MSHLNRKKRFLILTNDTGFGHRSAANSIAKAVEEKYGNKAETFVINPFLDYPAPAIMRKTQQDYDQLVRNAPGIYKLTYEVSDSRLTSCLVEQALIFGLYKSVWQVMQEIKPDGVVLTHEIFNAPTGEVLDRNGYKTPLFTVVTDLSEAHALWFNPRPDHFFVGSDAVKQQALNCGIAPERVTVSGIPVDPGFAQQTCEKQINRKTVGLIPDLTTFLMVGSRRVKGIYAALNALEQVPYPFQVAVIAGGDDDLYHDLKNSNWNFPVHVENFVANMLQWMACSDVLITKAGGLIVSEGLAAGLPILLIDSLPGQESGNVRYVTEKGVGVLVKSSKEFLTQVSTWLAEDCTILNQMTKRAQLAGCPGSAFVIADSLWDAA
jgi:1,2-diacylglycerol 3-beta-galactosyltransferase